MSKKTIVVCDIQNIEHLFHYRYGPQSDFLGYIDKYCTFKPFSFSIKEAIIQHCQSNQIVENISDSGHAFLRLGERSLFCPSARRIAEQKSDCAPLPV